MELEIESRALRTPLRASYERVRVLDAEAQLRECVDLLQNPDVLANDLAEAYVRLDSCCEPPDPRPAVQETAGQEDEIGLERFAAGMGITVTGDEPAQLRCLAGGFDPLAGASGAAACPGLDYVAMQHGAEPVLGAVASVDEASPYAVLLRLLCCFTEMATPAMLRHWDQQLFKGALGAEPRFHLQLVLWRLGEKTLRGIGPAYFALHELTRDLAELASEACIESPPLGSYLASISCLRIDPEDFEGPLAFEWRI
jgi:hypothetical protein